MIEDHVGDHTCELFDACVLADFTLEDLHVLLNVGNDYSAVISVADWTFFFVSEDNS